MWVRGIIGTRGVACMRHGEWFVEVAKKTSTFLGRRGWRWRARADLLWKGQIRAPGGFGGDGTSFHGQSRESVDGGGVHDV